MVIYTNVRHLRLFEETIDEYRFRLAGFRHGDALVSQKLVYHTTPIIYAESILQNGLHPKEPAHGEPCAVYVSPDLYGVVKLSRLLFTSRKNKCDYTILEIDATGLELYRDPFAVNEGGLYTLSSIDPTRIKVKTVVDQNIIRNQKNWGSFWNYWFWKSKPKPEWIEKFDLEPYSNKKAG